MLFALVGLLTYLPLTSALGSGNFTTCCNQAIADGAYLDKNIPKSNYVCGQTYSNSTKPAPNLIVEYGWCIDNCGGWGDTSSQLPVERLAPLLQYILPAVVFSMTIPRRKRTQHMPGHALGRSWPRRQIPTFFRIIWWFIRALLLLVPCVVFVAIDFIIWVVLILALAGPMIFSGIYEILLDFKVLDNVHLIPNSPGRIQVLEVLISGNLDREKSDPQNKLRDVHSTQDIKKTKSQLIAMLSAQPSFGSSVGAAILFYAGSFIYTIQDIKNKKGDTDTADALAFGMWWMTIVHVSIIAGCLLASNNPSTAATLTALSQDPSTPTVPAVLSWSQRFRKRLHGFAHKLWKPVSPESFQPVWMYQRGDQKLRWLKDTNAWQSANEHFRNKITFSGLDWALVSVITQLLVSLPWFFAFYVEFQSPKAGLGCRSLTLLVYMLSQTWLTAMILFDNMRSSTIYHQSGKHKQHWPPTWDSWSEWTIYRYMFGLLPVLLAVFTTVAGTLMEMIGVYQSCLCSISATAWSSSGRNTAQLYLASDTIQFRNSAELWTSFGYGAVAALGFMSYMGYLIQRDLRTKFEEIVEHLDHGVAAPLAATIAMRPMGQGYP